MTFNPLYKTGSKSYCYYCEKSYNNGYFKRHTNTKIHKTNMEKCEGFILKRTRKYNYNLNILKDNIKEIAIKALYTYYSLLHWPIFL